MNQVTHIFAKDVRRFWPEITVVLAITALFAWLYPHTWRPEMQMGVVMPASDLAYLTAALMPMSWWILITRLVHGESLVGDKQWWVTKPYEWPQLLGAKVLFAGVFVAGPLLIAQWTLLARAGFGAFGQLPGQGYDLLLIAIVLMAPVAALAEATSSFARLVLTAFGAVLVLIADLVLIGWREIGHFSVAIPDGLTAILLLALIAVMIDAYARRRMGRTRLLLAAIGAAGMGLVWLGYAETLIASRYPAAQNIALGLSVDGNRKATASGVVNNGVRSIALLLPVRGNGMGADEAAVVNAVQVRVSAPDGQRWTSPWEGEYGFLLRSGDATSSLSVQVDEAFLQRVKTEPLQLDLRLAGTEMRAAGTTQVAMASHDIAVPGFGVCSPVGDFMTSSFTSLTCRAPLRDPGLTYVTVQWSDEACGNGATPADVSGAAWVGSSSQSPANLNLAAVWSSQIGLSNGFDPDKVRKPGENPQRYLCPGSPMTFERYALVRRGQSTMAVTDFHVPDWTAPAGGQGGTGVTVRVEPARN